MRGHLNKVHNGNIFFVIYIFNYENDEIRIFKKCGRIFSVEFLKRLGLLTLFNCIK
jgi:hypothetical protein